MRVAFFGSGVFAVPSLRAVAASRHEVVSVVTQPARPAGRGGHMRHTPIAETARELGLEAVECANVNEGPFIESLAGLAIDVIAVADFGQFVRGPCREVARLDAINLHGSLLPELRGAAPINWAILRGFTHTGVTTFSLVDRVDAGDMYLQAATDLSPQQTAAELRIVLAELGGALVVRTLDALEDGSAVRVPQDETQVTKAPRLTKDDGRIDWSAPAPEIRNRIHGTWDWPGAHTRLRRAAGKDVDVLLARAAVELGPPEGAPGTVCADGAVTAGGNRVRILEIQPAGKRLMPWADFMNGYRVAGGDRFEAV